MRGGRARVDLRGRGSGQCSGHTEQEKETAGTSTSHSAAHISAPQTSLRLRRTRTHARQTSFLLLHTCTKYQVCFLRDDSSRIRDLDGTVSVVCVM